MSRGPSVYRVHCHIYYWSDNWKAVDWIDRDGGEAFCLVFFFSVCGELSALQLFYGFDLTTGFTLIESVR